MVQFAQPMALFALGALALPVLLYLLRRPRQLVRVGSLRPLEGQRTPPALLWRPRWLLLLLRCALLAVVALLLADPRVNPPPPGRVAWLLRAPGTQLTAQDQAVWDRALRDGWQPRAFAAGFEAYDHAGRADPSADYWSLLAELDARVEAGSKIMVFAPTTARHFRGVRPVLSRLSVAWRPVATADAGAATATAFTIVARPDRTAVADRVRAALLVAGAREDSERPTWIIQLTEDELAPALRQRVQDGATLVTEAKLTEPVLRGQSFFVVADERVPLRQRVEAVAGLVRWRDEVGDPLLTERPFGRGRHWQLAFRLDAEWTDWTLRAAFPRWWAERIGEGETANLPLDAAQVLPLTAPVSADASPSLFPATRGIASWLWLLAVALLAVERWVAWRQARRNPA